MPPPHRRNYAGLQIHPSPVQAGKPITVIVPTPSFLAPHQNSTDLHSGLIKLLLCSSTSTSTSLTPVQPRPLSTAGTEDRTMSSESRTGLANGSRDSYTSSRTIQSSKTVEDLNSDLKAAARRYQVAFHGDDLLGDKQIVPTGTLLDIRDIFVWRNAKQIWRVISNWFAGHGLDVSALPSKAWHGLNGQQHQWD